MKLILITAIWLASGFLFLLVGTLLTNLKHVVVSRSDLVGAALAGPFTLLFITNWFFTNINSRYKNARSK